MKKHGFEEWQHNKKTKTKKLDNANYSISEPGYQAWLSDGNKGEFDAFLEAQEKISNRQYILGQIMAQLQEMTFEELEELLGIIQDKTFLP